MLVVRNVTGVSQSASAADVAALAHVIEDTA